MPGLVEHGLFIGVARVSHDDCGRVLSETPIPIMLGVSAASMHRHFAQRCWEWGCRLKSLGARHREFVGVVCRLDATEKTLIADGRKVELCLVLGRLFGDGAKHGDVSVIFQTAEQQDGWLGIAEARDSVFACGKGLAGCHELKRYFHYDLILGLSVRRNDEPSDASRSEEHTSELQSRLHLVCRLLLEKKKTTTQLITRHTAI